MESKPYEDEERAMGREQQIQAHGQVDSETRDGEPRAMSSRGGARPMVSSQCEGGPHLIKAKPGPSANMWIWYEHLQPHQVADEAAAVGRDHLDIEHDCLLGRGGQQAFGEARV